MSATNKLIASNYLLKVAGNVLLFSFTGAPASALSLNMRPGGQQVRPCVETVTRGHRQEGREFEYHQIFTLSGNGISWERVHKPTMNSCRRIWFRNVSRVALNGCLWNSDLAKSAAK